MAIHSINDFKHLTGLTGTGRRRSPFLTLSYNADQPLHDDQRRNPEKPYHIKHPKNDNTKVILTEIYSSDPDCQFADVSIPSALRREAMWNELVRLNNKNLNRILAYTEIALPNIFDMHMINEFSKLFCESLSEHFKRPIDWSVHDKTKNGQRNLHAHIAIPERELNGTKWGKMSVSYYIDMDGNPIYNKIYKDKNGHDIRKPQIKKDAPKGHEYDTEIDAKTGEIIYKYQVLDDSKRKQWIRPRCSWLNPTALRWIHNEYDRVCNQILKEYGINDTVKRYSKEAKTEAKKAGLTIVHSNIRDAKANTLLHQENEQRNQLARRFLDNHENIKETQKQIESVENDIATLSAEADDAIAQKEGLDQNFETANNQYAAAKMIIEKKQRELFSKQIKSGFQTVLSLRNQCLVKTEEVLRFGISIINEDIQKLKYQKVLLPSQRAKLILLEGNKRQLLTIMSGIKQDKINTYDADLNEAILQSWRSLDRASRAGLIYAVMGGESLSQYKEIFDLDRDKVINKYVPAENTIEQSFRAAVEDSDAPSIAENYNRTISAKENVITRFNEQLKIWQQDLASEYHTPPRNMETLLVISTVPEKYIQIIADNRRMDYVITAVPSQYNPLLPYQQYINNWSDEEYKKYIADENKRLEELKTACIDTTSKTVFDNENDMFNEYLRHKKIVDSSHKIYMEVKEEEEVAAKKRSGVIFEGTVDERRINTYRRYYEQDFDELHDKYPDGFPEKPDFESIRQDVAQEMKDKTPKQLLILAKEIKVSPRFIGNYNIAKAVRNDYESLKEVVSNPLYGVSPVAIRWEDKEHHKLNEMEKAERNLYRGWHPK